LSKPRPRGKNRAMDFIPDIATLLKFSIASIVLFITPGPDMSLFLSRTLSGGRRAGIASVMGANVGCVVQTMLAAFGISALVAASQTGFLILKIVGAGYLLWLAVEAFRNRSALSVSAGKREDASLWKVFTLGIACNLTNPKVVIFFITFLPQFVEAADPHLTGKLVFLGLYFVLFNLPLSFLMIWGADRLVAWLRANPKVMRGIDYVFGGVFGLFAISIALMQAKG
jgi:threonine/homoserine/homoserine lactone efflux protein